MGASVTHASGVTRFLRPAASNDRALLGHVSRASGNPEFLKRKSKVTPSSLKGENMDDSDLNKWAEELTKEVSEEYSAYAKKFDLKWGFEVFYSPVSANPALMIIGLQPGGDEHGHFPEGVLTLHKHNLYNEGKFVLSKKLIELFTGIENGRDQLGKSVAFNLIFFRAPNIEAWGKIDKKARKPLENFSFDKVKMILKELCPPKILIIGVNTYDRLVKVLDHEIAKDDKVTRRNNGDRLSIESKLGGYNILAITHLTGVRVSKGEISELREILRRWLVSG
jgi:hypothetical protein